MVEDTPDWHLPEAVEDEAVPTSLNADLQDVFTPFDFRNAKLNLHQQRGRRPTSVFVFVHGFMGQGYNTFQDFPKYIFEGSHPEGRADIAIYDYFSGHRQFFLGRASLDKVAANLAESFHQLSRLYDDIYIVAHSMGGLITLDAIRKYLQDYDPQFNLLKPIAGVILFDSPLEGSIWSVRFLGLLVREFKILSCGAKLQRDLRKYFDSNVDVNDGPNAGNSHYSIPLFAAWAELGIKVVSTASATAGIPQHQQRCIAANHSGCVKPKSSSHRPVKVVMEAVGTISRNRATRRKTWSEGNHQAISEVGFNGATRPKPRNVLVVELHLDPDAFGWKMVYDEVLRLVSETSPEIRAIDAAEGETGWHPDLLLSIHKSVKIVTGDEAAARAVKRVRERYEGLDVRTWFVSVGNCNDDAVPRIEALAGLEMSGVRPKRQLIMIAGASGDAELRQHLTLIVESAVSDLKRKLEEPKDIL
ncbi:alpha/beta fold hydrolase [Nocardia sp. GTS18]|uniref:alpha/beta fold hydrolase n=1 Tax=Nocardia sp. GTS18 TaxID=1778064 RepID=UPI0015EF9383|nr:alpha/beta hydrolase [Nocardia sp. GTS18]